MLAYSGSIGEATARIGIILWMDAHSEAYATDRGTLSMAIAIFVKETHLEGVWRIESILEGEYNPETQIEGRKRIETILKGVF